MKRIVFALTCCLLLLSVNPVCAAEVDEPYAATSGTGEGEDVPYEQDEEWHASNMRATTSWLSTVGSWQEDPKTAKYFENENVFRFQDFLEDLGATDVDFLVGRDEDNGEILKMVFNKDNIHYYVVTTVKESGGGAKSYLGATGLDGLTYNAMSEEDYFFYLQDKERMKEAASRDHDIVINVEEGFFMDDETFNDLILVVLADPKMVYPESETGESQLKLCPFDGIMPHMHTGSTKGSTQTGLSYKHTTLVTVGSDWYDPEEVAPARFYAEKTAVNTVVPNWNKCLNGGSN